jgi:prevent-host-death family protein
VLRAVESGETIIVVRNGTPVAELRPLRRRQGVPMEEWIAKTRYLPPIDFGRFRADIDAAIDPAID